VLPAIQFDREALRWAVKIHDVSADGSLSAEAIAGEALETKDFPKSGLGVSRLAAHGAGGTGEARGAVARDVHCA
jgi:hypothetical protein